MLGCNQCTSAIMSRGISDSIIEEVRQRSDIIEIINSFVPLKKAGGGSWKGLCPFHQERTPSFHVNANRQFYHCFGCGKHGDVFRFIMEWEKMDFPEAVRFLAQRCGVIVPEEEENSSWNQADRKRLRDKRERMFAILKLFADFYHQNLIDHPNSAVASYFRSREIPMDVAEAFQIGAAPDSWEASLQYGLANGFSEEELLDAGIVLRNAESNKIYDRFRNRLIFSIWDEQGRVVAFSARTVEAASDGAKYVNSPETAIFKKSKILYALPKIRQAVREQDRVILCEGQLDVIAVHRAGFPIAVAPQGTAFTEEQAQILKRYAKKILVAFDSDSAGVKAVWRALEILLPLDFEVGVVHWPGGKDPDELLRTQGRNAIGDAIAHAIGMIDFICWKLEQDYDLATPFGKSGALDEALDLLLKINNPIIRDSFVEQLSERFHLRSDSVFAQFNSMRKRKQRLIGRSENHNNITREGTLAIRAESLDAGALNAVAVATETVPNSVSHAAEVLFSLAYESQAVALCLAEEVPGDLLDSFPAGKLLNELIACAVNDEWGNRGTVLTEFCDAHPEMPQLAGLLVSPERYTGSMRKQAYRDCLETLFRYRTKKRSNEIFGLFAKEDKEERRRELMEEFQRLSTAIVPEFVIPEFPEEKTIDTEEKK